MNRNFKQLRRFLDGDDPFMVGGHQISEIRKRCRVVPDWTRNDGRIREVLLRAFPNLRTDNRQKKAASRWAAVVYLYFRLQYTNTQTAAELKLTIPALKAILRSIRRVAAGRRADGTGLLSGKKGRPIKHAP